MSRRADHFREHAADCVMVARQSSNPKFRAVLLEMAQKWLELADGPIRDLNAVFWDFNERQMIGPVPQQQQQIQKQPKKK
jgi:hypothetical protein